MAGRRDAWQGGGTCLHGSEDVLGRGWYWPLIFGVTPKKISKCFPSTMAIKAPCPHCEPGNLGSLHYEKPRGVLETDWVSSGDCVTVNLFLYPRAVPMLVGPHQRMDLLLSSRPQWTGVSLLAVQVVRLTLGDPSVSSEVTYLFCTVGGRAGLEPSAAR